MRQYHLDLFPRRRVLLAIIEAIRRAVSDLLIDSAPIPVCTYQRSRYCAALAGPEYYSMAPLCDVRGLRLIAPPRRYDKVAWPEDLRRQVNPVRRRMENGLSVLSTVFHVQPLGSRLLSGLDVQVASRILANTLSFSV